MTIKAVEQATAQNLEINSAVVLEALKGYSSTHPEVSDELKDEELEAIAGGLKAITGGRVRQSVYYIDGEGRLTHKPVW